MSERIEYLFALLAAMMSAGCALTTIQPEITSGSCEGSPYEKSMELDTGSSVDAEADVWAEADGDDVVLHLDDLDANCCPSPGAEISQSGSAIQVIFEDVTSDEACSCMCIMDFTVRIPGVGPGSYTLDVDYYQDDLATVEVTVP